MKGLGGLLVFFGVGSIVLNLMEREFVILSWIDNWGENVGWGIKIGFIVVGGLMWLMGGKSQQQAQQA